MTEFTAFILGVIVGANTPPCKPKNTSGSKSIRNIAYYGIVKNVKKFVTFAIP